MNLLLQQKPDLVICAGDMVAGQKTSLTDRQLAAMWEVFETLCDALVLRRHSTSVAMGWPTPQANDRRAAGSMQERQQASHPWNRHQDALPPELTEADNFPFQRSPSHGPGLFLVVMDASSATVSSAVSGNGSPAR